MLADSGGRAGWVWLLAGRPAWGLRAGRPAWRLRAGRGARLAAPPLRSGDRGAVRVGFRLRACAPSRLAVVGRSVGSSRAVLGAASRPDPPYGPSRPGRCPCARARLALPSSLLRPAARCSALRLHPPQNDSPCPLHYAPGQPATAPQPARSPQARLPASSHTQPPRPPAAAAASRCAARAAASTARPAAAVASRCAARPAASTAEPAASAAGAAAAAASRCAARPFCEHSGTANGTANDTTNDTDNDTAKPR